MRRMRAGQRSNTRRGGYRYTKRRTKTRRTRTKRDKTRTKRR